MAIEALESGDQTDTIAAEVRNLPWVLQAAARTNPSLVVDMSKTRIAEQGMHLSRIAAEEGFADFHTIFDHAENAALKAKRDPHILFPGDKVFVPDRKDRREVRATDASHRFVADIRPLFLRCRLLDWQRDPIAAAPCKLSVDGSEVPPTVSDGQGFVQQRIGRLSTLAEIDAQLPPPKVLGEGEVPVPREADFHVKIGSLNPITKLSGQQARLNNLGYPAGYDVRDLDQLLWAAEEFLCDDTKGQRVKTRLEILAAPAAGEDDPATSEPDRPTGVQSADWQKRLEKVHGF